MSYAILRIKKINSLGGIAAAGKHIARERETPNADSEKTPENLRLDDYRGSTIPLSKRVKNLLPEKVRKNAVLAVEHMMTASPKHFQGKEKWEVRHWAESNMQWLRDRYGSKNVVHAEMHLDESTPHIHAVIVPKIGDKLNARELFGGREKMQKMQDSYAEKMDEYNLERGIRGSRAKHTTIREYYARINKPLENRPVKNGVLDAGYKKRLEEWETSIQAKSSVIDLTEKQNRHLKRAVVVEQEKSSRTEQSLRQQTTLLERLTKEKRSISRNFELTIEYLHHKNKDKYMDKREVFKAIRNGIDDMRKERNIGRDF